MRVCSGSRVRLSNLFEKRFGPVDLDGRKVGYLVVLEELTPEEWMAKFSPKEPPPADGAFIG
jgi:hypothetical protein